jgi:hypothetical protein
MKQRFLILVVGGLFFAAGLALDLAAQEKAPVQAVNLDQLKENAPKVYIDCQECDIDYIRTEITFVNYVRDRKEADVKSPSLAFSNASLRLESELRPSPKTLSNPPFL